ncbi:hypothetical protein BDA96_07G038300 [Sorghum bicolor]|uniref:Uncharacterized protein n=2 Tax=Sorghum bicolor TaxID=4558 RepID=A0A1B6PFP5_SORBI|nr:hypothetical protein BDA96_07G038300 [Sorghum bicolor]KXG24395.1 hypothetical protein SORBI_3007G036500 [Sorghum bicolor]
MGTAACCFMDFELKAHQRFKEVLNGLADARWSVIESDGVDDAKHQHMEFISQYLTSNIWVGSLILLMESAPKKTDGNWNESIEKTLAKKAIRFG